MPDFFEEGGAVRLFDFVEEGGAASVDSVASHMASGGGLGDRHGGEIRTGSPELGFASMSR